jgi:hypothetical protein
LIIDNFNHFIITFYDIKIYSEILKNVKIELQILIFRHCLLIRVIRKHLDVKTYVTHRNKYEIKTQ